MKVLFFANAAEATGVPEINLKGISTVAELKHQLLIQFPGLEGMNFSVAVNKTIVPATTTLTGTDEVAILPPFSGG